eukprot:TRINITY_DN6872_c0_g1_i2.p1 TRINITY_DN6872_c0_g1~~TRINITY_DN6872_c0_g1_i2.p1  ORF type:complete len:323 (+),score=53.83 TRINITY_DN6872_c0_g1_i2:41-970(+)
MPYMSPPKHFSFDSSETFSPEDDGELLGKTRNMFDSMFQAMDGGLMASFLDKFAADSAAWMSNGLSVNENAVGKTAMLRHYNKVFRRVWGGGEHPIHFHAGHFSRTGRDAVSLIVTFFLIHPNTIIVKRRSWNIAFAEDGLIRLFKVTPAEPEGLPFRPPSMIRPCSHNNWDSVRVKRKWCLLRCRMCGSQWRLATGSFTRCHVFTSKSGCSADESCPLLHIHHRKQTLAERRSLVDSSQLLPYYESATHLIEYSAPGVSKQIKTRRRCASSPPNTLRSPKIIQRSRSVCVVKTTTTAETTTPRSAIES